MTNSIRTFLLISLLLILTLSISLMIFSVYYFDQYGIQQSLDKLLKQSEFSVRAALDNNPSAAMLAELQKSFDNTTKNNPLSAEESYYYHYFQVWNHNNQLVLQSPRFDQATVNFINSPLGFSNQRTGNQTW